MKRMLSVSSNYESSQPSTKKYKETGKTFKRKYRKPNMSGRMLSKLVQKELRKQSETKHVSLAGIENSINTISSGTGLSLLSQPYPQVGPEPHQRIGNKISPVGFSFKGVYWNTHAYPIVVRRLIMQIEDGETANTEVLNNMFEGTATNTDTYDLGNMDSLIKKVNREGYKVLKDDCIHLGINNGGSSVEISKVYCKLSGSQMYKESGATHAVNDRIVVVHIAREADGDESTGSTIELTYALDFYYKDF